MNQRQAGGMGDELTNAALVGLVGIFGIALVLRAAGSVAAFLTGTPQPDAGAAAGLAALFNPGDPATALGADGLNPVVYWLVSAALLGGLAGGIVWVWIVLRRHTRKTETDPHRLAGIATSHEVKTAASARRCFTAPPRSGPPWSHQHRRMSATCSEPVVGRRSGHRSKTRSC